MTAELACAVLSYQGEPHLVDAVRSVLAQEAPVEVVVVNSGGGEPAARLAAAGVTVPVHDVRERLFPGGARNLGIARTRAPYVAFLAADCLAAPGWAAARLRAHRAGAAAVASPLTNAQPESTAAWAALLLLHNRRLPRTRPRDRLLYGLSYERSLFERFGLFREDLRAGEDTELNARIAPHVAIALAEGALTAHRYPTTASTMLRDAFRRGRLQARMQGALEQRRPQNLRVATRGPLSVVRALGIVARSPRDEQALLLRALPLLLAGGAAYTLGALTTLGAEPAD